MKSNRSSRVFIYAVIAVIALLFMPSMESKAAPSIISQPFGMNYRDTLAYKAYKETHPNSKVTEAEWPGIEQLSYLQNQLTNRMETPDIYQTRAEDYSLLSMMKKGYYVPLKGERFDNLAGTVYPQIAEYITRDGEVAMVPVRTYFPYLYQANPEIMEKIGMDDSEIPGTLIDLLCFAADWPETYGRDFPEYKGLYCFVGDQDVEERNFAAALMMKAYLYSSIKSEGSVRYDTALFNRLLDAIDPFTQRVYEQPDDHMSDMPQWGECLFYVIWGSSPFDNPNMKMLAPLPLDAQSPTVQPLMLTMAHLNPFGKAQEDAAELLSFFAKYPQPEMARIIGTDRSPLEKANYEENQANYERMLERANAVIDRLDEKERLSGQDERDLKDAQFQLNEYEKFLRNAQYEISPEQLTLYNVRLAPWLYICGSSIYEAAGFAQQADRLLIQYLDGVLPREQLIASLDNAVRLMALENQ